MAWVWVEDQIRYTLSHPENVCESCSSIYWQFLSSVAVAIPPKTTMMTMDGEKKAQVVGVGVLAKEALVAAGRPSDEKEVRETFAALDANKDGKIDLDEFKAAPRELAWWEKGSY